MVFVNSKKFACESCIKGHRSSSCHHTDRPLFEIKKKGRPVSQCEKCRELRQSRRVHSKCNCPQEESLSRGILLPSSSAKSRRYIPIAPALPNGLRDVPPEGSQSFTPPDSRQRVDSLLNPCNCRSVWKCKCRAASSGLAHLAQAAALCCRSDPYSSPDISKNDGPSKRPTPRPASPKHRKRPKYSDAERAAPGPDLPPILFGEDSPSPSIPTFAIMPPISTITSIAGSGCTCGFECACPGCVQHRGQEHAAKDRPSCADGCGTCVDAEIVLPGHGHDPAFTSPITGPVADSFIDRFLARAAALPAPPSNRKMGSGVAVDPMNVIVYPAAALESDRGVPFGLVNVPKLCCDGRCACPSGDCSCGKSCDGSCREHHKFDKPAESDSREAPPAPPTKSCCCA